MAEKIVVTVADLVDVMGFGYAYTVGHFLDCLHQASQGGGTEVAWLGHALTLVDKLKTFSTLPSYPVPYPKLDALASHALPPAYAKAVSLLWMRPGQPHALRAAVENLLQDAAR